MNYKKFETQLNKLYSFYEATKGDGINDIERDLLKSYIMKLYEHLHADEGEKSSKTKKESKTTAKVIKAVAPPKPKKVAKPKKQPVEVESVEIIPEVDEVVEPVAAAVAPPAEPAPTPPKAKAKAVAAPVVKAATSKSVAISDDMKELFADFSNKELGDKLSQMPIKDLTKALSINERVFTIKELFAGDSERFRNVIKELNDLSDFDAAKKSLMSGVATDYKWYQTSKLKKARNFIKIIKRRYN